MSLLSHLYQCVFIHRPWITRETVLLTVGRGQKLSSLSYLTYLITVLRYVQFLSNLTRNELTLLPHIHLCHTPQPRATPGSSQLDSLLSVPLSSPRIHTVPSAQNIPPAPHQLFQQLVLFHSQLGCHLRRGPSWMPGPHSSSPVQGPSPLFSVWLSASPLQLQSQRYDLMLS